MVRGGRQRRLHKAFLRYHDPENWPLLREALQRMGRADLIGNGKHHLVPAFQPAGTGRAATQAPRRSPKPVSRPIRPAPPRNKRLKVSRFASLLIEVVAKFTDTAKQYVIILPGRHSLTNVSEAEENKPASGKASLHLGESLPEDQLHHDPLLDCLVELTRIHGRPSTRAALSAGLPLPKIGLTPSLFHRAASRAGFASKVVRRPLEKIDAALLPAILLLDGNEACVLLGWEDGGANAQVLFPDTGQGSVTLSREMLEARYAGIAIFARPHFRFDQRTPESGRSGAAPLVLGRVAGTAAGLSRRAVGRRC